MTSLAEYMQSGRATEKTDVYSFGVLVLEVLSGKRPTDASFIEKGLNIVGWVCLFTTCSVCQKSSLVVILLFHGLSELLLSLSFLKKNLTSSLT